MSKFIEKLQRLSQVASEPIGFRPRQQAPSKPKIQLVAVLSPENLDHLTEAVTGADAVLLPIGQGGPDAQNLAQKAKAITEIPWGVWLRGSHSAIAEWLNAGCDFFVFPAANTPVTLLETENNEMGKVLEVESSLTDGLLRAINELPINAVLVTDELAGSHSLTWHHLMLFQRLDSLLTKPLLVPASSGMTAGELQALWGAGVDGLLIEVAAGPSQDRLKELRQIVDNLTFPLPRRRTKVEAVLPHVGGAPSRVTDEEEEEEETEEE